MPRTARLSSPRLLGMAGTQGRAHTPLRPRPDSQRPRFRCACRGAVGNVPRRLPRCRRARQQRMAGRPRGLRLSRLPRRHGGADRPARCRGGRLGRHLDGRARRHVARGAAGGADPPPRHQRRRPAHRQGGPGAHRLLCRARPELPRPRRDRGDAARGGGAVRPVERCAMAPSGDAQRARQARRQPRIRVRPAYRRRVPRRRAGRCRSVGRL